MRVVIDLQGLQTESRYRGIGRYTQDFIRAVLRNLGGDEVFILLNGMLPESILPIRRDLGELLPNENIRVWHSVGPTKECDPRNQRRRSVAELCREEFLLDLQPDVIHVSSLFEGYLDDGVTSIGQPPTTIPTTVTLYDLIPLIHREKYLTPDPLYETYYHTKLGHLRKADVFLTISEATRLEGAKILGGASSRFINISTAANEKFVTLDISSKRRRGLLKKLGIFKPFLLYTGGADPRKNLVGLIEAFAMLSARSGGVCQLALVGRITKEDLTLLRRLCSAHGLNSGEVIFADYVDDDDLVCLYNLCHLFVFPTLGEGFGLPVLEAMNCGAPVIASDIDSVREIVGLSEALFDPMNISSILQKMEAGISDKGFRERLISNGLQRSRNFSWDQTAKTAISVWRELAEKSESSKRNHFFTGMIYDGVVKSIIADKGSMLPKIANCFSMNRLAVTSRQLLVDVSELSQRDAGTGVQRVVRGYLRHLIQSPPDGFNVRPVFSTVGGEYRYAWNFMYRFMGYSEEPPQEDPIEWCRGDIFLVLDMQHHVQLANRDFIIRLVSGGVNTKFMVYDLLPIHYPQYFADPQACTLHENWLMLVASTNGAICISKATSNALAAWIESSEVMVDPTFTNEWLHIGADLETASSISETTVLNDDNLKVFQSKPTFLCVSTLEPRKRQAQILDAFSQIWRMGVDVNLVFVGRLGWMSEHLGGQIEEHPLYGKNLFWLRDVTDSYLREVYSCCTCLIMASIDEGFGLPLVEASQHGIPIIARDIPVFREVAGDNAFYFSGEDELSLRSAVLIWLDLFKLRKHVSSKGMRLCTWEQSTERLKELLIGGNYCRKQLFVDVSELSRVDAKTGIQRVVKGVLNEWLNSEFSGYRVEPVTINCNGEYEYAEQFVADFVGRNLSIKKIITKGVIEFAPGDIFFALDFCPTLQARKRDFYQTLMRVGVDVRFMVHDLLPVTMPEYFDPEFAKLFVDWIDVVTDCGGAVCVSEATANDLSHWILVNKPYQLSNFEIDVNYNGADWSWRESCERKHDSESQELLLNKIGSGISFLMVGTLEGRKGHEEVLNAFELLWDQGLDFNLIFVGKPGWSNDKFLEHLKFRERQEDRLFWPSEVDDGLLDKIYGRCHCVVLASKGEGFGLPLMEAAIRKIPIIARDIPVFREIGKDKVFYFSSSEPGKLSESIKEWVEAYQDGSYPRSDGIHWLTYDQSARALIEKIFKRTYRSASSLGGKRNA
jgi:glycosyltransferase involved in cell wall biosynthesis